MKKGIYQHCMEITPFHIVQKKLQNTHSVNMTQSAEQSVPQNQFRRTLRQEQKAVHEDNEIIKEMTYKKV